jgi:hypothetical protein
LRLIFLKELSLREIRAFVAQVGTSECLDGMGRKRVLERIAFVAGRMRIVVGVNNPPKL